MFAILFNLQFDITSYGFQSDNPQLFLCTYIFLITGFIGFCQDKLQGHSSTFQGLNFKIQGLFEWGTDYLLNGVLITISASVVDKCWYLFRLKKHFNLGAPKDLALPEETGSSSIKEIWGNLNNLRQ